MRSSSEGSEFEESNEACDRFFVGASYAEDELVSDGISCRSKEACDRFFIVTSYAEEELVSDGISCRLLELEVSVPETSIALPETSIGGNEGAWMLGAVSILATF